MTSRTGARRRRRVRLRDVVLLSLPLDFLLGLLLAGSVLDYVRARQFDDWWSRGFSVPELFADRIWAAATLPRALSLERRTDPEGADPGIVRLRVTGEGWQGLTGDALARWSEWTDAVLLEPGDARAVELRKRGDTSVHWLTPKKSFTLKTSRTGLFKGYRRLAFSVKDVLPLYVSNRLAAEFGLLAPSTGVAPVFLNDRFYGMFRWVEPVDESFLRRHGRMPGNLWEGEVAERGENFKGLPRGLFHYPYIWERTAINDRPGADTTDALRGLIEDLQGGSFASHLALMGRLDREEIARFVAYLLAVGDPYHMDNLHNQVWYEDPSTGLLHPIPWDVRLLDLRDPPIWVNHFLQSVLRDPFVVDRALEILRDELADEALARKAEDLTRSAWDRYRSHFAYDRARRRIVPDVGTPAQVIGRLRTNLDVLRTWMEDSRVAVAVGAGVRPDGTTIVDLETRGYAGADLVGLDVAGGGSIRPRVVADRNGNGLPDAGDRTVDGAWTRAADTLRFVPVEPVALLPGWDTRERGIRPGAVHYRLFLVPPRRSGRLSAPAAVVPRLRNRIGASPTRIERWSDGDPPTPTRSFSPWSFPAPRGASRIWRGGVRVGHTLRVGRADTLIIEAGTTVVLDPEVSLVVRGHLEVRGAPDRPVRFQASDARHPWGALALQGPGAGGSVIRHARFSGGGGATIDRIEYTGMVNVHGADDVRLEHVELLDNLRSDDALHVLHARVFLSDCRFRNANGDAVDLDYATGRIERCRFEGSRNDAVDLMTSSPAIIASVMTGSGDKGISIGERSRPLLVADTITGSTRGIEVKDGSEPVALGGLVTGNGVGLLENVKNWRYGAGGRARLVGLAIRENAVDTARDQASRVTLPADSSRLADEETRRLLAIHGVADDPELAATAAAGRAVRLVAREAFVDDFAPIAGWRGTAGVRRLVRRSDDLVVTLDRRGGMAEREVDWDLTDTGRSYWIVLELTTRAVADGRITIRGERDTVQVPTPPEEVPGVYRSVVVELPPDRYTALVLSGLPGAGARRVDPRTGLVELDGARIRLHSWGVYAIPRT
ncbi:MAG: CotH kinase family protein [Gemmatimonadota bacterium]